MRQIEGILLIYNHPVTDSAPTIMEHVNAFSKYSNHKVWSVNSELGFPKYLKRLRFKVIIFHYSLFGLKYLLNRGFQHYTQKSNSYKIAFFQDEHRLCKQRYVFIQNFKIDCIFTLLEPVHFKDVYEKYTNVTEIVYNLTGYVDDNLKSLSSKYFKPLDQRTIDVGYRGRSLDFTAGKGGQEKIDIAVKFLMHTEALNLRLDIKTGEEDRIYGHRWFEFIANCKAMLGVEAGVSVFDVEDEVANKYEYFKKHNPEITFEEFSDAVLYKWENNIYYRTISPRIFEAAAFKVCQVLFKGSYSGVLKPMIHYIPLEKDFSNIEDVLKMLNDNEFCEELIENSYRDLIASGEYSYQKFIAMFDSKLKDVGISLDLDRETHMAVDKIFEKIYRINYYKTIFRKAMSKQFPGKKILSKYLKPYWQSYLMSRS